MTHPDSSPQGPIRYSLTTKKTVMQKMTRELAGRTATTDFQAQRRTMVKPVIIGVKKNGNYLANDGCEFDKDIFDRLFPDKPKRKISKRVPKENADKTKDWMK